jgi:hypothetical protein
MLQQGDLRAACEPLKGLAVGVAVLFQEVLNEERKVFAAFGKSRNANFDAAETVEKIIAKASSQNLGAKIAVRGGNQSKVYTANFG